METKFFEFLIKNCSKLYEREEKNKLLKLEDQAIETVSKKVCMNISIGMKTLLENFKYFNKNGTDEFDLDELDEMNQFLKNDIALLFEIFESWRKQLKSKE